MAKAKDLKWGYISPLGEFVIAPAFDGAADFYEDRAAVKVDWARGYIDRSGHFVIEPEFEAAGNFKDGVAVVKIDGQVRCVDRDGRFRDDIDVPDMPAFQPETGFEPHYELHDGLVRFVENQKFGYKDAEGNIVVKAQFFDASDFSEGLACVKKGKTSLWCYIDTTGNIVIPALFNQAHPFREGLAAVLVPLEV